MPDAMSTKVTSVVISSVTCSSSMFDNSYSYTAPWHSLKTAWNGLVWLDLWACTGSFWFAKCIACATGPITAWASGSYNDMLVPEIRCRQAITDLWENN